jgi:hypothetical protein
MKIEANRLYSDRNNNSNKFSITESCKKVSSDRNTRDWLELESLFDHESPNFRIYKSLLEKRKTVVVKIGPAILEKEYTIGNTLKKLELPTFLIPYCIFTCNDKISDMNQHTKYICKGTGDRIYVILMPYIELGRIDKYTWNRTNFHILKSIFKHIFASLFYAAITVGFLHSDLHPGNVLLKKTTRKEISYGPFGTLSCVGGIIPILMDYDRAKIDNTNIINTYNDIKKILTITETEIDPVFELSHIRRILEKMFSSGNLSPTAFQEICQAIDSLSITRLRSEKPPPIDFTKW